MAVLTHIDRVPFGAPTPEEIAHDKIAKQHFLEYCDSGKCIRGAAHARKANWHEGFCVSCAYNPYNMAANDGDWRSEKTDNGQSRPYFIIA